MRKVIVNEFLSLDGTAQAPGGADEDTTGGFRLGGRTYELFAGYWPQASEDMREIAEPLNTKPKYVASRTLADPLEWQNSRVLSGPLAESVAALKEEDGGDLLVMGSTVLVQSLIQHGLVDELRLLIDPVLVGGGKRIFPDDGALRPLRLVDHEATRLGTIVATYAPA